MIVPKPLKKGAKIGIVATARKISKAELLPAIQIITSLGYQVQFSEHLFGNNHQFSGTDQERASDLMSFLQDPNIDAILCARGGYGSIRLLPYLDKNIIEQNPKWLIGYSDVTVIHALFHQHNIASLHATMPINFKDYSINDNSITSLFNVLEGNDINYQIPSNTNNRLGNAEGVLIGGNLSILYSLRGTPLDIDTQDKILFIEDLDEYLYHIDRMIMNLKISGIFENIKALIVGGMSDMNDNTIPFGKTAEQIILEAIEDKSFPVVFNFPAGHIHNNLALPFGKNINLEVLENSVTLKGAKIDN